MVQVGYDDPIENGVAVRSANEAMADITGFSIQVPSGIDGEVQIFVSPPGTPDNAQLVAFVIQSPKYGLIDVVEGNAPQPTVAEYNKANEELVQLNDDPDTHGKIVATTIRGGREAFVSISEDGQLNTIFWMEDDIEIAVEGPTLSEDQAIELANAVS
jgi:hypothetical protein